MAVYPRADKYPDLLHIYSQCSGPGALKTAEFVADRIGLAPGMTVLDIGIFRGIQTCFLAKEYGCRMVAIDPWVDNFDPEGDGRPYVEHLRRNAASWGVADTVIGVQAGVPDTPFADNTFDAAYSTTALEMIRGFEGNDAYIAAVREIHRVLKPGALFGMAEPMHRGCAPPPELAPLVSEGDLSFDTFVVTPGETAEQFQAAGFTVLDAGHAQDAQAWWEEFAEYDWECRRNPDSGDRRMIEVDAGRWLSVGYVIARKPAVSE
jgi:cyclopropane fatty-acyl-phospholipid synthase-like methyltransferase